MRAKRCMRRLFSHLCIIGNERRAPRRAPGVGELKIVRAANRVTERIAETQRMDHRRGALDLAVHPDGSSHQSTFVHGN